MKRPFRLLVQHFQKYLNSYEISHNNYLMSVTHLKDIHLCMKRELTSFIVLLFVNCFNNLFMDRHASDILDAPQ